MMEKNQDKNYKFLEYIKNHYDKLLEISRHYDHYRAKYFSYKKTLVNNIENYYKTKNKTNLRNLKIFLKLYLSFDKDIEKIKRYIKISFITNTTKVIISPSFLLTARNVKLYKKFLEEYSKEKNIINIIQLYLEKDLEFLKQNNIKLKDLAIKIKVYDNLNLTLGTILFLNNSISIYLNIYYNPFFLNDIYKNSSIFKNINNIENIYFYMFKDFILI